MKPDDNWRETRVVAEDMELLVGVPCKTTEEFLIIIENLIIHRFVEEIGNEDFRGKDCQIELPYLGSLIICIDDKNKITTEFTPRNSFYRKIRSAYVKRESPLVDQCAKILGDELVEKFKEI